MTPWPRRIALVLVTGALLSSCSASRDDTAGAPSTTTPTTTTTVGPILEPGRDLYAPPDPLAPAPPGTLIWAQAVDGLELDPPASVWRILYHSRSRTGADIAVSGFAVVPTAAAPPGGRPVYAWAHGTVGLGDQCAPSHAIRDNLPPFGGRQVERGAVLVATDFEGLGTPGVPTSTVALAEGHAVLDSVRATASLPGVGPLSDVVLAGHSQGGRAALVAAEISPAYAPDLSIAGVVAFAPGVELPALVEHLIDSGNTGMVLMGAIGLRAAHPEVDLADVFTSTAIADVARVESECIDATAARYLAQPAGESIHQKPSEVPAIQALLEANSPGLLAPAAPVLITHGADDRQVPAALAERLSDRYCALGATVTNQTFPDVDHDDIIDASMEQALAFIDARYNGEPAPAACG